MAASTAVHSRAFDFLSYIESGVDPRTGQYTLNLTLPEIKANDLSGPIAPLTLGFNPLNITNSGFGIGWELRLSQYDARKQIIALSTGETFKVTGETSDNQLVMAEQKIPSFHFYRDGPTLYRVVHKSGTIEMLRLEGNLALPETVYSPEGFKVSFAYLPFDTGLRRLHQVTDGQGVTLLEINRPPNSQVIEILLRPDGSPGGALARFELKLRNSGAGEEVCEVILPTEELASWRLTYKIQNGLLCLIDVKTPVGGHETLEYAGTGHAYPGFVHPPLPRVWKHIIEPGFSQAPIEVHYEYETTELPGSNNFLGNNDQTIKWDDNGLDNLFQVTTRYQYATTERHYDGGVEVRRIERTFNRFHLLTEEKTIQGDNVQQVFTLYYADDNLDLPFANQPAQCQLPKEVRTRWGLKDGPSRTQTVTTAYDSHGNLTKQIEANGVSEEYEYFPVAGIVGECPKDPQGFVRSLRSKTVTPATNRETGAPQLSTRHKYALMDPVQDNAAPTGQWLAMTDETLYEVDGTQATELQHTAYITSNTPTNALLHGRRAEQSITLNDLSTTTEYAYKKLPSAFAGETILQTVETLTGYDHGVDGTFTKKVVTLEHSLLHGEPLLARDDNDVEIRTAYDALLRVTSETVAPETDYRATRSYSYFLTSTAGEQASQETTDVKGVKTKTLFDGVNRVVQEQRQDKDFLTGVPAEAFRDTYLAEYDGLGQLIKETEYDWCSAAPSDDLVLVSEYQYDNWGQQRSLKRPDGVEEHEVTDPIKQTVTQWITGRAKTVTTNNLFDKPDSIRRYNLADDPADPEVKPYSEHLYYYDGLGRTAHEFDALMRKTAYVYDPFDRMLRTVLPDDAQVERRYALHSSEDLPVWIGVHAYGNVKELGQQSFDGLDRMTQSITGGRVTRYNFKQAELKPCKVIRPSKVEVDYVYEPALGEDPVKRTTSSTVIAATYDYDEKNARLKSSEESGITLSRDYFTTGEIKTETRQQGGETFTMHYGYSRQARLLKYVDVLNQEQVYDYNKATGQLLSTRLGTTVSRFGYNPQGEIESIETADVGQTLKTTLSYDDYGRESLRVFDFGGGLTQELSQAYDEVDNLTRSTLKEGATVLRDQTYEYDIRGHLELYECSGTQQPVDPYGKAIEMQRFIYDELSNIEVCDTYFADGRNRARYSYDNQADPTQLTAVTNDHDDYPRKLTLPYDDNGNLKCDEEGRELCYDDLDRLISVSGGDDGASRSYGYDPLDTLSSENGGSGDQHRFYQSGEIHTLKQGANSSTFVHAAGLALAELQDGADPKSLLLASDQKSTVLCEASEGSRQEQSYSPYGYSLGGVGALGFNGELREGHAGQYILGSGYRAYSPTLMRCYVGDNMSPFSKGGINPYMYCLGDPVGLIDDTGHFSKLGLLATVLMESSGVGRGARAGASAGASAAAAGSRAGASAAFNPNLTTVTFDPGDVLSAYTMTTSNAAMPSRTAQSAASRGVSFAPTSSSAKPSPTSARSGSNAVSASRNQPPLDPSAPQIKTHKKAAPVPQPQPVPKPAPQPVSPEKFKKMSSIVRNDYLSRGGLDPTIGRGRFHGVAQRNALDLRRDTGRHK
ncbi:Sugar-binding protein [Pseudomonas sp. IT-P12]|uniref:RHS repeat domain-containing protein n=1 Tax=Pseudomonas sp. IT-P12 TaxID=3026450 RepID=UPI0039DFD1D3